MSTTSQNTATPTQNGECINQGRPVYFSYARNSNKKPEWEHISDCVDAILKEFEAQNIEYRLDKRDIGTGDRISDFEKEIGWNSEVVVLVFSDKYFRSMHCMYEFVQIKKALKKYPNKRLLCIKSGNFNLSDSNYIYELEHYWGDMKQEYEEIERHHSREHSGTEKAAYENGFYFDDILDLYPFFSALNYTNANNNDWSTFVADIKQYYIDSPKSLFDDERKRKSLIKNLKIFVLGTIFTLLIIAGKIICNPSSKVVDITFPEYNSNLYLREGFVFIKSLHIMKDKVLIEFHAINTSDDTLSVIPVVNAPNVRIVADGKEYYLDSAYTEGESKQRYKVPKFFPGGNGCAVDFSMEFPPILPGFKTIDLVDDAQSGIFGLKLQREELLPDKNKPENYNGSDSFKVKDIDINKGETILYCQFSNITENDYTLSTSLTKCYITADGKRRSMKNALGIPLSPESVNIPKGTDTEFALFFEPIDKKTASIDLVFNDSICVKEIKLHKSSIN